MTARTDGSHWMESALHLAKAFGKLWGARAGDMRGCDRRQTQTTVVERIKYDTCWRRDKGAHDGDSRDS